MKKILKMPLRRISQRPPPAESLRSKAAANAETYGDEDYETEEPNMKFSHALIVVLALHIIAVGGVFAFNSIKAGQSTSQKTSTKGDSAPSAAQATAEPKPSPVQKTLEARTGKTYTVQAGDTLSRIAALYKVGIEAIEKENGITSYSMIRVGQVLKIPAVSTQKPEANKPSTDPVAAAAKQAFLAARTDMANPPALSSARTDAASPPSPGSARTDTANSASPGSARTDTVNSASPSSARPDIANPPAAVATKSESAKLAAPTPQAGAAKTHVVAAKPLQTVPATPKPASAQPSPKKVDEPASPAEPNTYVVTKGDNPYSIAKKLHVSYNELIAINDIKDPTRVQIGQKLKIPAKKN
jgi:LysM repeat protein